MTTKLTKILALLITFFTQSKSLNGKMNAMCLRTRVSSCTSMRVYINHTRVRHFWSTKVTKLCDVDLFSNSVYPLVSGWLIIERVWYRYLSSYFGGWVCVPTRHKPRPGLVHECTAHFCDSVCVCAALQQGRLRLSFSFFSKR